MKKLNRQRGQGMTEYIVIVALVAIAAIGVYALFGDTVKGQVAGMSGDLSGEGGSAGRLNASEAATAAATASEEGQTTLKNYGGDGDQ